MLTILSPTQPTCVPCRATPRALLKHVRAVPCHVPPDPFAIFSDIIGLSLQLNYIKLTIAALKSKDISSIGNSIDIQAEVLRGGSPRKNSISFDVK